jgi:DNA polymerase zeta
MKTRFFVYESHISFILQFMCDFGLYGCGWMDLADVWKRGVDENIQEEQESESSFKISPHPVQSRMQLEVDAAAHQILNRQLLTSRDLHHKLSIPAPPLPTEPLVLSVRELWDDERRRRQAKGLNPTPEIPVDPSDKSRGPGGDWVAEARWWDEVRKRIESEKGKEEKPPEKMWERWVPTTFESVDGLWEDEFKSWKPADEDEQSSDGEKNSSSSFSAFSSHESQTQPNEVALSLEIDVDESLLSSQAVTQLVRKEEAEWETMLGGDALLIEEDTDGEEDQVSEDDEEGLLNQDVSPGSTPVTPTSKSTAEETSTYGRSPHTLLRNLTFSQITRFKVADKESHAIPR